MACMLVMPEVSHAPRSWSKAEASANMSAMFLTLWTAQPPMSWLNDEAPSNILCIEVTPEVSHAPMSSLKDAAAELHLLSQSYPQNKYVMSVTPPVAHVEMWPYVASAAVASESHAATACLIFQLTMTLPVLGTSQSLSLA